MMMKASGRGNKYMGLNHIIWFIFLLIVSHKVASQTPATTDPIVKSQLELATSPPGVVNVEVCEGASIPALSVTGTDIRWYTSPDVTELVDSRDGRTYGIVPIGDKVWMAENLNFGSRINGNQSSSNNGQVEKYCYNNSNSYCDTYGGLYQWDELMDYSSQEGAQGICPSGWHIPSHSEWKELEIALGMTPLEADKMQLRGTNEGTNLKVGGTSGFEALMAGKRNPMGIFQAEGSYTTFWTSSQYYNRTLSTEWNQIYASNYDDKSNGFSIRCVKDDSEHFHLGNTYYTNHVTPGTYTYYVSQTIGGEESSRVPITLTIHPSVVFDLAAVPSVCEGETVTLDAGAGYSSYLWNTGSRNRSIIVTQAGNYNVKVTNSHGCEASDQVNVSFYPLPNLNIVGQTEACEGEAVTLDAGAVYSSYIWNTGSRSRSIEVKEAGSYDVTVNNSNGCEASDQVNVSFFPLPNVSIAGQTEACDGKTVELDAGSGYSTYEWNTGETTRKIIVVNSGKYTVSVSDGNGCENSDQISVVFNPCFTNHRPEIDNQEFSVDENEFQGQIVGIVKATDQDSDQSLKYTIDSGNENDAFNLKSDDGMLTVGNPEALNYEEKQSFNLVVKVQDNGEGLLSDWANISIIINDQNEYPKMENQSFSVDENSPANYFVGTIIASDEDLGQKLEYEIRFGNSYDAFRVDDSNGNIFVNNPEVMDYDRFTNFQLKIRVTDNAAEPLHTDGVVNISINELTDLNDEEASGVHIYPNPTTGKVMFVLEESLQVFPIIELYNSNGNLVNQFSYSEMIQSNYQPVEINIKEKGLYFLKVRLGDQLLVKKIICL